MNISMIKRSLYQCFNAKVKGGRIYCNKGYKIGIAMAMTLPLKMLKRGAPLESKRCQDCPDYDEMGPPVPKEDRGWLVREYLEAVNG